MHTTRRTFLGLVGAASGWCDAVSAVATPSEDRNLVTEGDKVGPPPMLAPLPPRSYPNRRQYLVTDGSIRDGGGGFAYGLWLHWIQSAGVARCIPYGLDIQTDEQKLWLLGRRTFAPRFEGDLMAFVRRATSRPHQPSWSGRIKQQFPPIAATDSGRLVPDTFD